MKASGCAAHERSCKLSDADDSTAINFQDTLPSIQDPRLLSFALPHGNVNAHRRRRDVELVASLAAMIEIQTPPPRLA
jgi:hypothetical protein